MPKEGKDNRGRKEHELKSLIKTNAEARNAFVRLVQDLGKMKSIEEALINDGLRFSGKVVKISNISTPTLAAIIKESGQTLQRGRPVASGSTVWKNKPQAIEAVCNVLRKHGLHKGRCYLLDNGITFKNENGEDEHFAFSHNGKKLLSITTLSDIAKENNIAFVQGPRVERVKALVTDGSPSKENKKKIVEEKNPTTIVSKKEDEDEWEDEDEDEEDEGLEDEEDEDEEDEDLEDEEDEDLSDLEDEDDFDDNFEDEEEEEDDDD